MHEVSAFISQADAYYNVGGETSIDGTPQDNAASTLRIAADFDAHFKASGDLGGPLACIPVLVNVLVTLSVRSPEPQFIGLGASLGLFAGFLFVFVTAQTHRKRA